jgi:hypothetical protein
MGTKSRESIYRASVRASAERAAEARRTADQLAREAWNKRMLAFQGPAQPSPTLADALNAGYLYLEVKCLGCNAGRRASAEDDADPRTGALYALPSLLRASGLSVQAQPPDRAADHEDFDERSAVIVVAG